MRLIDAELLEKEYIKSLNKDTHQTVAGSIIHVQEHNHILHLLEKAPTVNVVTEERCREIANEMKSVFINEALKRLSKKLDDASFYITDNHFSFGVFDKFAVVRMSTVDEEIKKTFKE